MAAAHLSHALKALQRLYPVELAGSWDNVGLLVDVATARDPPLRKIFFCNDLVPRVLDEALALAPPLPGGLPDADGAASLIVTYHPTPFHAVKKITKNDNVGKLILRCASSGVAVYSPHTACDCAPGGVNDWLASGMGAGDVCPVTPSALPEHAARGAGEGRILKLSEAVTLKDLIGRIKSHLKLEHVRVALAFQSFAEGATASDGLNLEGTSVSSVAMCAGCGSSVLAGVKADVWLTGELSHHEILAANAAGTTVILTDHTNTERGYLPHLAGRLEAALGLALPGHPVTVLVTAVDADPLVTV